MQAFYKTDIGKTRSMNQDYVFCSMSSIGNLPNLLVVADGMGGHQAGDFASRFTVETLVECIRESDLHNPIEIMTNEIKQVNNRLYQEANANTEYHGMGTTLVLATIFNDRVVAANIGDSRVYLMREHLQQISEDHSLVEELVRRGELERGSEGYRSKKNIITQAIGVTDTVRPDFFEIKIKPGDQLLLCSDGLTNMVSEEQIASILHESLTVQEKVEALIKKANAGGGHDNISVILADLSEGVNTCCE